MPQSINYIYIVKINEMVFLHFYKKININNQ